MQPLVRPAVPADSGAIARIYNQGIDERSATFETAPRSAADIEAWFAAGYPVVVVVESAGAVAAFAAAFPYRPRPCYVGVREFSVYVAREARRHGLGLLALNALCEAAARAGAWKLVSRIFVENRSSRRLCARAGFREVGIYRRHGKLDGKWRDCVIVEKLIGEAAA